VDIEEKLRAADVILLLVSPDFLASDFINQEELSRTWKRHESGSAIVIPIIVRPADWLATRLGTLQALPRDGKAITTWRNRDVAWQQVVNGIRTALKVRAKHGRWSE
jgi:hypothetical protein